MPLDSPRPSPRTAPGALRPGRDMSRPLPAALTWTVLAGFVAAVAVLGVPLWLPAVYGVMSVIALAAYGMDKSAARRGARRLSEQTLLTLSFACG